MLDVKSLFIQQFISCRLYITQTDKNLQINQLGQLGKCRWQCSCESIGW